MAQSGERVLLISSLAAARDGSYQAAVQQHQDAGAVLETEMIDRLTDNALTPPESSADLVHIVATEDAPWTQLLPIVRPVLAPGARIAIDVIGGSAARVRGELLIAGFDSVNGVSDSRVEARRPEQAASAATGASAGADTGAADSAPVAISLKRRGDSKKASLWATEPEGTIDAESLLTDADRLRPQREGCTVDMSVPLPRRKKACKNCTCGLRELQENEEIVKLDSDAPGTRKEVRETVVGPDGVARTVRRVQVETRGATSSCGSCFLGDAFRCSSCPYLGMPAFRPGERVQIPATMDDDI
ncbi:electron carrier [Malassezia cuniculi]|uniref:Electron carrier n=1 Tax=Malassezia cuniculi TaxID=948313 RepID=A0AAF0J5P7_9BASI|nr:electron carrier [Malassezia cuniculi]